MQALFIDHHGSPSELHVSNVAAPARRDDEVRVQIQAAGVNPSDVVSAGGRFPQSRLPRILGRDFAGRVVEGPRELIGVDVWGSGGDLGISRDGTHAEQVVLPASAVARRPSELSAEQGAAAGLPFVTAWSSLIDVGNLARGEWIIVSGAAGSVGRAASELARARGAHIIALVLNDDEAGQLDRAKVDAVARSERGDLVEVTRQATHDRGADLALNGVGAPIFQPLMDSLADGGRMVVYSAAAGREAPLDLFTLYRRRLQIASVDTAHLDATACARILASLQSDFESGTLVPLPQVQREPLSAAPRVYERVAHHASNKFVLVPDALFAR